MKTTLNGKDLVKNRIGYLELNKDGNLILKHFDRYNDKYPFSFTEVPISINSRPFTLNKRVKLKGTEEKIYRILSKKEGTDNVYTVENTVTKEVSEYSVEQLVDDTLPLIANRFCIIVQDDYYSFRKTEDSPSISQKLYYHVKDDSRNNNNTVVLKVNKNETSENIAFNRKLLKFNSKFFRVIDIFDVETSNKLGVAIQKIQSLKREYKENNEAIIRKKIKLENELEAINKTLAPATHQFIELSNNILFELTNEE